MVNMNMIEFKNVKLYENIIYYMNISYFHIQYK